MDRPTPFRGPRTLSLVSVLFLYAVLHLQGSLPFNLTNAPGMAARPGV